MAKSVRLGLALERRLEEAAQVEGVSVSAFIRDAVARRCDEVLSRNLRDRLGDIVGAIAGGGGVAERTGEAFKELLVEKARGEGLLVGEAETTKARE